MKRLERCCVTSQARTTQQGVTTKMRKIAAEMMSSFTGLAERTAATVQCFY